MSDDEISDDEPTTGTDEPESLGADRVPGEISNLRESMDPDRFAILEADINEQSKVGFTRSWVEDTSQRITDGQPQFNKQAKKDIKKGVPPIPTLNLPAGGYYKYTRKEDKKYQEKPPEKGSGIWDSFADPLRAGGKKFLYEHPKVFVHHQTGNVERWVDFRKSKMNAHIPKSLMASKAEKRELELAQEYINEKTSSEERDKRNTEIAKFELENPDKNIDFPQVMSGQGIPMAQNPGGELARDELKNMTDEQRARFELEYKDVPTGRIRQSEHGWTTMKDEPDVGYSRETGLVGPEPKDGYVKYRKGLQPKPDELAQMEKMFDQDYRTSEVNPAFSAMMKANPINPLWGVNMELDWTPQMIESRVEDLGDIPDTSLLSQSSSQAYQVGSGKMERKRSADGRYEYTGKRVKTDWGGGELNKGIPGLRPEDKQAEWDASMDKLHQDRVSRFGSEEIDLRDVPFFIPDIRDPETGLLSHRAQKYPGVRFGQGGFAMDAAEKERTKIYARQYQSKKEQAKMVDAFAMVSINPAVAAGKAVVRSDGKVVNDDGVVFNPQGRATQEVIDTGRIQVSFEDWLGRLDVSMEEYEEMDAEDQAEMNEQYEEDGGTISTADEVVQGGGVDVDEYVDEDGPNVGNRVYNVNTGLGHTRR